MSDGVRRGMSQDRGERKLVTTLFADLTGFTALSEVLDPEEVRELVNGCFDVLVPVVEACGGTVDKFIGDELMALFGAPAAHEDDVARCLTAALEMMERFAAFAGGSGFDLGMHVGVETGIVVSGGVGSRGRQEYSVIGDAVNLSSRLADASEAGQILVGPSARRLAGDAFQFTELEPLGLKGKAQPVPVFQLEGAASSSPRSRVAISSRLVGRDQEMRRIGSALSALDAGQGRVITVCGEPGLGKSRLVAELRSSTPPRVRWAEGRGRAFGRSTTYAVAVELIDDLAGVAPDAPAAEIDETLRAAVREVVPEDDAFAGTYPYLAWMHGLPLGRQEDERVRHLSPEALRDRLRAAFTAFVRARCLQEPLALVWEDLHWADASSLALVEGLLPLTQELPLACLLVYRPHEGGIDDWGERVSRSGAVCPLDVTLTPLDARESSELVAGLLPVEDLPDAARHLVLDKAEGNPFFIEELLRSLVDAGVVLARADADVADTGAADLVLPDTLHGVAAARIDALEPDDKENLQSASVIGREFQRPVLAGMRERAVLDGGAAPSAPLGQSLDELCRREFIRVRSETDYVFKHAVTREVAYSTMLRSRRRDLHRYAAEVIEEVYPDRLDELVATLGRHWQAAGVPDRALGHLLAAAERARRSFSSEEALELYAAALEAAAGDERRARIEEDMGDLLALAARFDDSRRRLRAALDGATRTVDRARLLRKIADTLVFDRPDEAASVFKEAEAALGPEPDGEAADWWRELIAVHSARLKFAYWVQDTPAMSDWATWATATLERPEAREERGTLMRMLATHDLGMSRYRPSVRSPEWTAGWVEQAERNGDLAEIAEAYFLHAFVLTWRDETEDAMSWFGRTIEVCRRIGDVTDELRGLTYLAVLHRRLGEVGEVARLVEEAEGLLTPSGLDPYLFTAHGNRAWVAWRRGDLEAVRRETEAAWEVLARLPHMPLCWIALWPLVAVRVADGDVAGSIEAARRLVDPASMLLPDELEAQLCRAVREWEAGAEDAAGEALALAVRRARSEGGWL